MASSGETKQATDPWAEWLLRRRHGGSDAYLKKIESGVAQYADRVLDGARLAPGMVLADIGSGEGLVAFHAIERVAKDLHVILTDVSADLLQVAREHAEERGVSGQCEFLQCGADDLSVIGSESVDVVTTRSVLAYVANKRKALQEFLRVLRPGGRISLAEPIMQDEALASAALRAQVKPESTASADRFLVLLHRWKSAQYPDTAEGRVANPLVNFSERDLVNLAVGAGFKEVHLELHIDVIPAPITDWETFITVAPHPLAPSLAEILATSFSAEEREFFEQVMRPTVERGSNTDTYRMAYLTASKPLSNADEP